MNIWEILGYSLCVFCGVTATFFIYIFFAFLLKVRDKTLVELVEFFEKHIDNKVTDYILVGIMFTDTLYFFFMMILAIFNSTYIIVYVSLIICLSMISLPRLVLIYISQRLFPARCEEE